VTEKYCKYCDKMLSLSEFPKRSASADGLGYKCSSCCAEYNRTRYAENAEAREDAKRRAAAWHKQNATRSAAIKAGSKARRLAADPEYDARRARELRKKSPEKARAAGVIAAHRRRAAINNVGDIHPGLYKRLMSRAGGVCTYCNTKVQALTVDHFNAVTRGGGGNAENLIPACKPCNSSKGNKIPEDWIFDKFGIDGLARVLRADVNLHAARLP
jgi:5-methylcytosine-specific restriction endonuclease McrA